MIDKVSTCNNDSKKRARVGRPRVAVTPTSPGRARVAALMARWNADSGMSLREMTDGLNAVYGATPVTFQALALWAAGRNSPRLERAKNGLLLSLPGSWQRRFWREMVEAISQSDPLLTTRLDN